MRIQDSFHFLGFLIGLDLLEKSLQFAHLQNVKEPIAKQDAACAPCYEFLSRDLRLFLTDVIVSLT